MATGKKYALSVVVEAVDRATAPLKSINKSLNETFKPVRQLGASMGNLVAATGAPRVAAAFGDVKSAVGGTAMEMAKLGVVGAGIGYAFKRTFVDTAATFEKYQTTLETIEGSAEGAQKAMDWVSAFAAKTPFQLDETLGAFVKLRAYGMEPTNGLLKTLGDTASAMGKDINQAVEAIADAVTGENERLKEFGIKARKTGNDIVYEYTKDGKTMFARAKANDRAMIQSTLEAIFNSRYKGAMEKQSKTFNGMLSNISDQWTRFQNMVMKYGPFDWLKDKLGGFLDMLDRMAANGELERLAKQVGTELVVAFNNLWAIGKDLVSIFRTMFGWLNTLATGFGSWKPILIALGVIIAGPLIASIITLGSALAGLGLVIAGTPIGLVLGGIALAVTGLTAALGAMGISWGDVFKKIGEGFKWIADKANALMRIIARFGQWIGLNKNGGSNIGQSLAVPGGRTDLSVLGGYNFSPSADISSAGGLMRGSATTQTNKVILDFQNVPKGVTVQGGSGLNTNPNVDMNLGYAMGGF